MEAKRNVSRNWLIAAVVVGTMMLCVGCAKEDGKVLARDDFDGEFTLDWQILNADPTHFSLTKNPGTLTITTQEGGFHGSATGYKNLFLIDCPAQPGEDFQITTHISSFKPAGPWNQAGLVCWQDEDNYLKWVYERAPNDSVFTLLSETAAQSSRQVFNAPPELDSLWLRINKRRNFYTVSTSLDGQSFVSRQTRRWGDGTVPRVGLVAKNGSNTAAPEVDAAFGFFAVRTVPAEAPAEEAAKYVIPQENLEIAEEMKTCGQNLKKMYAAIKKYEKDKGDLPNWLSDLVPDYFSKELLLCPSDPSRTRAVYPDPKLPCGYTYEFCPAQVSVAGGRMSCRDWKTQQVEFFGDIVPVVRCLHHGSMSVNVSMAGRVYSSPETWETIFMPGYTRGGEFPGGPPQPTVVSTGLRPAARPSVPKQPPSLVGKPLPELKDLKVELSPADANDKTILVCFWDMEQRPSRHMISELAKRAEELKEKGVTIVSVQAAKADEATLSDWVRKYNVPFPVGMVEGDVEKAKFTWGVKALPWLILTDRKHMVHTEDFGLSELDEKISAITQK